MTAQKAVNQALDSWSFDDEPDEKLFEQTLTTAASYPNGSRDS